MLKSFIKNNTPYLGKIILKFEKFPHYSGSLSGKLNKIHLNFGFTKLVSRIIPDRNEYGWVIDPEKVKLIESTTGGVIKDHKWWIIRDENGETKEVKRKPKDESIIINDFILPNSFLTKKGKYVGSIDEAWRYYNNNLYVCEDYPHGVAEKIEKDNLLGNVIVGYYGYTHRGGGLFKIGDRLFDPKYIPKEGDYMSYEWNEYVEKYRESCDNKDEFMKKDAIESGIQYIIPFNRRGLKDIETLKEAKQAAINLSKYLS
jgi:hypothetical protein